MSIVPCSTIPVGTHVWARESDEAHEHPAKVVAVTGTHVCVEWATTPIHSLLAPHLVKVLDRNRSSRNPSPNHATDGETVVDWQITEYDNAPRNPRVPVRRLLSPGDEARWYSRREVEELARQIHLREYNAMTRRELRRLDELDRAASPELRERVLSQESTARGRYELYRRYQRDHHHYLRGFSDRMDLARGGLPPRGQAMLMSVEGRRCVIIFLD